MGARNAKADLKRYRDGYPGQVDNPRLDDNWRFYSGEIESVPHGKAETLNVNFRKETTLTWYTPHGRETILSLKVCRKMTSIHVPVHHGYIQWLFPIREHGMNSESQPLQLHEIEKMKADPQCMERFLRSYEMQLHFYGCVLDRETGSHFNCITSRK